MCADLVAVLPILHGRIVRIRADAAVRGVRPAGQPTRPLLRTFLEAFPAAVLRGTKF